MLEVNEILFDMAKKAFENAYAPYSKFKVGAAILSENGNYYQGCNVENISYPCGTCAEAGAIAAMIAAGDKKIAEIMIVANSENPILPCGACLQRIQEFSSKNTKVYSASLNLVHKCFNITELLPNAFFEEGLGK